MKPLDTIANLKWCWHTKMIPLKHLNLTQLKVVDEIIRTTESTHWHGIHKDTYLNAIKMIRQSAIPHYQTNAYLETINSAKDQMNRASNVVDQIFSQFKNGEIKIQNLTIK